MAFDSESDLIEPMLRLPLAVDKVITNAVHQTRSKTKLLFANLSTTSTRASVIDLRGLDKTRTELEGRVGIEPKIERICR